MKLWKFEFKRRENTVWDFVVPLSLVLLQLLVFNYSIANATYHTWYHDIELNKFDNVEQINLVSNGLFLTETIFLILLLLSILFISRKTRTLIPLKIAIITLVVMATLEIFPFSLPDHPIKIIV